jgi:hypothetical protein
MYYYSIFKSFTEHNDAKSTVQHKYTSCYAKPTRNLTHAAANKSKTKTARHYQPSTSQTRAKPFSIPYRIAHRA